jgi:monoamine oxidase
MSRTDVIIVGAGAAGLSAARDLSRAGVTALVLEARDRIGGRILTLADAAIGTPVDMGAEFIHGRPHVTWDLVREAGQQAVDVPFEHRYWRGGRLALIPDFTAELDKVMGGLSRLRGRDVSFAAYVRQHCRGRHLASARRLANEFVEGFDAADPERISAKSLAREQEGLGDVGGEMQFRLLNGYGTLIEHLRTSLDRRRVKIRLEAPVSEVTWGPSGVTVRYVTDGQERTARSSRLIVTLPLGVLQLPPEAPGSVRFSPDIAAKRAALSGLASGPVIKAVLKFREPFWEDPKTARAARADEGLRDLAFMHDPAAAFPAWWTPRPVRVPVLTAWAGGPKARALTGLGRKALLDSALASLSGLVRLRRSALAALLQRAHVYDWPADPWARGAYSYEVVGGGRARSTLAKPLNGTLFFAGEATDTSGEASTVAGALASGQRAARQVLTLMGGRS